MNLDDFIVPTSVASPAGLPTPSSSENALPTGNMSSQGPPIPINTKQRSIQQNPNVPAASVPKSAALAQHVGFDGIPKRVRKTSIDERRSVSFVIVIFVILVLTETRTESALQISRLKYHPWSCRHPETASTKVSRITVLMTRSALYILIKATLTRRCRCIWTIQT